MERLEFYFSANGIIEDIKKGSILLTVIGKETYHLIRNLAAPTDLSFKPYAEIVKLLTDHLSPKPNMIVEQFKFYSQIRKEGESVAKFVSELRNLLRHCSFDNKLDDQTEINLCVALIICRYKQFC